MLGKSTHEYHFIKTAILGLRLVTPLSILYVLLSLRAHHFLLSPWIGCYAAAEAAFYLFIFLPRKQRLQEPATHPSLVPVEERRRLFTRCMENVRSPDSLAGWFLDAPLLSLKRDNVVDWIVWAIFGSDRDHQKEVVESWAGEIDDYVRQMEQITGHKFAEGRSDNIKSMRVTLDPVEMIHRPLLWYIIVALVDTITTIRLHMMGFNHSASKQWFNVFPPRPLTAVMSRTLPIHPNLSYWYRPHRSSTRNPIVFLHGIGIGLWPYLPFLSNIIEDDPNVGIIALEFLPISMRMTSPQLGREAICDALDVILTAHNFENAIVLSHSFGTVVSAYILRSPVLASRISGYLLVDPIPFMLHLPDVSYNFCYRPPRTANEWQLWYFASRDPDIARTLGRHFFWSESILFKEDLVDTKAAIVLGGCDQIVHSEEVWHYLTGEPTPTFKWQSGNLQVFHFPGLDHAVVFESEKDRKVVLGITRHLHQENGLGPERRLATTEWESVTSTHSTHSTVSTDSIYRQY